ncbi:MAG TPA: GntR family transcriptional regulator [Acidimicrobiales bacterium]|nr:GntR family transcriptional regulator [Acidimicrobiales bacterium]
MAAVRQDSGATLAGLTRRSPPKVSHLLAVDLRHKILTGELAADQRLPPEAELAAAFSVSRETLREALRILESQSLLVIRHGRGGGPVVRRPGIDAVSRYVALLLQLRRATLAQLEEARALVEPPAAEQFAVRATDGDLELLVARHDTERGGAGDPLGFAAAVAAFDQSVTELSGNRSLSVVAGAFREIHAGQVFQLIASVDAARAERFARRVIVSHSAFLDAARRRDGDLANRAWRDYLFTTSALAVSRDRRRALVDVTSLWRAQVGSAAGRRSPRRAAAVANEIRARIAEGKLAEGARLPPLPELAGEFDVSRPTLREALRVLEMERLLDLAAGDRGGAKVLSPSTLTAARLAGIALEGRGVTFADFYRAHRLVEPPIRQLAVERMSARAVTALRRIEQELGSCVGDSAAFIDAWQRADAVVFSQLRNPAITVIGEITRWVADEVERIAPSDVGARQWLDELYRHSLRFFHDFVEAAESRDGARARRVWTDYLDLNGPFFERSEIADRPLTGLVDGGALADRS